MRPGVRALRLGVRTLLVLVAWAAAFLPPLAGQVRTVRFQRLAMDEGLTQNNVRDIAQDSLGFLWFATQYGLSRYDGYTFTPFVSLAGDSTTLTDNMVRAVHVDGRGTLWVGTRTGGLLRFDPQTLRFAPYDLSHLAGLSRADSLRSILALRSSPDGRLWVGTEGGLVVLDPTRENARLVHIDTGDRPPPADVSAVAVDAAGGLWTGFADGTIRYVSPGADAFAGDSTFTLTKPILALCIDRNDRLWIGTDGAGLYTRLPSGRIEAYSRLDGADDGEGTALPGPIVLSLYEDRSGRLWIGMENEGIARLDASRTRFDFIRNDPTSPFSLSNDDVYSFFQDRTGVMWVGTWNGINHLSPLQDAFELYTTQNGLPVNHVVSFEESSTGELWIGTWGGGVVRFDRESGRFETFASDPADPTSLSYDIVFAIAEDQQCRLWIATYGGGLNLLDPQTGTARAIMLPSDEATDPNANRFTSVYPDREGIVWIGTQYAGLLRFDPRTEQLTAYHKHASADSLQVDYTWPLFEDSHGRLWIGTFDGGLHYLDRETNSFGHYLHDASDPRSISGNRISTLVEDKNGDLWIGTMGNGLNRWDRETDSFTAFTTRHGLVHDYVVGAVFDDWDCLWVSTQNGLSRYCPDTGTFENYNRRAGLQGNQFAVGSAARSKDGALFFGGTDGFNIVHVDRIERDLPPPPVVLTGLSVNYQPYDLDGRPAYALPSLSLDHRENTLSFTFAALDYVDATKNEYAYRLTGYDDQWVETLDRTATFTRIPHGTYTLQVKAGNSLGVWNDTGLSLPITIHPPFWKRLWFRFLMIGLGVGLLYGGYRLRVRRLLAIERMRIRIAGNLHDDIGANISSIAIKSELVLAQDEVRAQIGERGRRQITEIGESARATAHTLREIVWVVNADYDTLEKLLVKMEDVTSSLLEGHLPYTFRRPPRLPAQRLGMEFRQNVYFLYKEALHNAVKHARATRVSVEVTVTRDTLTIEVSDDGSGFDPDTVKRGNGLDSMQQRAANAGGRLRLASCPGQGTRIVFEGKMS